MNQYVDGSLEGEMENGCTPYEALKALQRAVEEKLEALEPELPPIPGGELENDPDDDEWLFDSRREYLEQLRHYKSR
jgi:hypothetical protein